MKHCKDTFRMYCIYMYIPSANHNANTSHFAWISSHRPHRVEGKDASTHLILLESASFLGELIRVPHEGRVAKSPMVHLEI